MPFISNVSKDNVSRGHYAKSDNMLMIRIDHDNDFPPVMGSIPKHVEYFNFLDIDQYDKDLTGGLFSKADCERIVNIFKKCIEEDMDIVVHCLMGVSRSGAIADVASSLGFNITRDSQYRIPNAYIRSKLLDACMDDDFLMSRIEQYYVEPE